MILGAMDDVRKARAEMARDVEYVKEMALDDVVEDRMATVESMYFSETTEELEEAANWVDRLDISNEKEVMESEVNTILEATEDITFDEMIGVPVE